MPIILFFTLLALLPDAEVLWSQVYPSWQSNVSLICGDASCSLSCSHTCGLPCSSCPTGPAWVDTRCYHWPDQMFLNQTSWDQMIPKNKLIGKRAWLVWKERGRIRCAGRQSKLLATRSKAPAWFQAEPGPVLLQNVETSARSQLPSRLMHKETEDCPYAHSAEHGGFISGNSPARAIVGSGLGLRLS